MDGDGARDYFWVDQNGKGWGYLNVGKGANLWDDLGQIAEPQTAHTRERIRMGVLTKSGRSDYIVVDDDTGRADWWQNLGRDGGWGWEARGQFADGPVDTLQNLFGMKLNAKNVRFAELVPFYFPSPI